MGGARTSYTRACVERNAFAMLYILKRNNTQKKNKDGVNGWLVICYVSSEIWRERERGELVTLPLHKYAGSVCVSTTHKHCTSIPEFFCRYITYLCALVLTYTEPENAVTFQCFVLECPLVRVSLSQSVP